MFKFCAEYTWIAHYPHFYNNTHCTLSPCSFVVSSPVSLYLFLFLLEDVLSSFPFSHSQQSTPNTIYVLTLHLQLHPLRQHFLPINVEY